MGEKNQRGGKDAAFRYAEKQAIDLIILATHGRTGLAHLLMGSVTEKVVRKGGLQPGHMFLVDTAEHRIIEDSEIKATLAAK